MMCGSAGVAAATACDRESGAPNDGAADLQPSLAPIAVLANGGSPPSVIHQKIGHSYGRGASTCSASTLRAFGFSNRALLRGTAVSDVLRGRARVLGKQPCTQQHYDLSAPVDRIDAFISHNWSVSRGKKFLALALHFNLFPAAVAATAVSAVAFALTVVGCLPPIHEVFDGTAKPTGVWCQLLGMLTFVLSLFYWHDVSVFFRGCGSGQKVFLDKTCLHQTDMALKQEGIKNLAAFILYSDSMVVLYSETYLEKLWTVYELATFLLLYPSGLLQVQPVLFPKFVLAGTLLICCSRAIFAVFYLPSIVEVRRPLESAWHVETELALNLAAFLPPIVGLAIACRLWAREFDNIHKHVKAFSITKASCLDERDRRIVERNVATFARHVGFVTATTARTEALASFDELVQREVPYLLKASLGRVGVPYRHAVMMFAVYFPYTMDMIAGYALEGKANARVVFGSLLWCVSLCFGIGPLCVALCFWMTRASLCLTSCIATLLCFCCIVMTTTMAYCVLIEGVANMLYSWSMKSALDLALFFFFDAILVLIAAVVFGRPRLTAVRRRLADSDSDDSPLTEELTEDNCSSSGNSERSESCSSHPEGDSSIGIVVSPPE
uniref:Transmembrane protein n=1 Tax=Zooxanthella nutricula TaxID=1333877 RepID=A0A7S2PPD7_9DINO|mmetsp:Transcript_63653/g.194675  ORF Transcript_63653/g.194675 Transcript_63653/m.194675 type:complete len:611 (+) Transcript_63653:245-2077(+)